MLDEWTKEDGIQYSFAQKHQDLTASSIDPKNVWFKSIKESFESQ